MVGSGNVNVEQRYDRRRVDWVHWGHQTPHGKDVLFQRWEGDSEFHILSRRYDVPWSLADDVLMEDCASVGFASFARREGASEVCSCRV